MPDQPTLCLLCPPKRARQCRDGGVTCTTCHDRLMSMLLDIAERYVRISAEPGSTGGDGGRRAPGFGSKPPCNLHNATLRDPRTVPDKPGGLHSAVNLMVSWAGWVRIQRGQDPVAYRVGNDNFVVSEEVTYLRVSLDWITRQPWVVTLAEQVRAVSAQVRSATGDRRPRPIGKCRHVDPDESEPCGHPLFPPRPGHSNVVCGSCDTKYSALEQVRIVKATSVAA